MVGVSGTGGDPTGGVGRTEGAIDPKLKKEITRLLEEFRTLWQNVDTRPKSEKAVAELEAKLKSAMSGLQNLVDKLPNGGLKDNLNATMKCIDADTKAFSKDAAAYLKAEKDGNADEANTLAGAMAGWQGEAVYQVNEMINSLAGG